MGDSGLPTSIGIIVGAAVFGGILLAGLTVMAVLIALPGLSAIE